MYRLLLVPLLLLLLHPTPGSASELERLEADNRLLKAEYALAKTGKVYLLFDLAAGAVQVRSSGLAVASWPIADWRRWGQAAPSEEAPTLVAKRSLFAPQRETIVVDPEAEKGPVEEEKGVAALELDDMPASYRLVLSDGTRISVRPAPTGLPGRAAGALRQTAWWLGRPFISVWHFLCRTPYNELQLRLPEEEARRLYWAFTEGAGALIRWPLSPDD